MDESAPGEPREGFNGEGSVADVAVEGARPAGGDGVLSYAVPERWCGRIATGQLVWVPVRRRLALGVVLRLHGEPPPFDLKPLHAPVEPAFCLDAGRLAVAAWLARETACSLFAAVAPFLPPGVTHRAVEHLRLASPTPDLPTATPAQRRLLTFVAERGEVSLEAARAALGSSLTSVVAKLEAQGAVERVVRVAAHAPGPRLQRFVRLVEALPAGAAPGAPRQQAVVDYLTQRSRLAPVGGEGLVPLADVLARTGTDHAVVGALARKGVVEEVALPRVSPGAAGAAAPVPTLTPAQAAAWLAIERALLARTSTPLLLHGVTGSGKTEVYLRAVAWCLRHGRSAVVLVP